MKHKIWIASLSMMMAHFAFAGDKEIVKSTITEVTVYAQGAQIYQKANYNVKPGLTEIIIEGISPYIDAKSLQVKATGNVVILDSKYALYYPKPEPVSLEGIPLKIKKDILLLEDSIRIIAFEIQEIQDEIDVLNTSKSILANNGAIRGQGKVNDSINLLKQAMEYYALKMNEINKKLLTLNKRKAEKNLRKSKMDQRMRDLLNYQSSNSPTEDHQPKHRVTVTVQSKEVVGGKITLSYLVSNAGWTPLYDLRSDNMSGKINLSYKANVYQNTGLDWKDVKLNISTNNPYLNKTKPTLHPWYIEYNQYRKEIQAKKADNYKSLNKDQIESMGYTNAPVSARSEEMDAVYANDFTTVVEQLISAEFRIDLPYTILSNNEQHMVLIKTADLEANYTYYAVPKLDNGVYLVAQLTKLDDLQLVPAQANIFFDGSYVGETFIDPSTMDDTLSLSLGKDPNILVKRTLMKKQSKEKIIGTQKEKSFVYQMEVKNLKSTNIEVILQDQVPITTNPDIVIIASELSKGAHDEKTGLVEWKINLKPKESKIIKFEYLVKHNKDLYLPY